MRYFVVVVALLGAGCSFTMHATAFRSSTISADTQEVKATAPGATVTVSQPQTVAAYPQTVHTEARNEAGQIVIAGVCYAETVVNLQGRRQMVLFPAVCQ